MDARLKVDPDTGEVKAFMAWHPYKDTWMHIAQFFEEETIKYFINGEEVTELPPHPVEMREALKNKTEEDNCDET